MNLFKAIFAVVIALAIIATVLAIIHVVASTLTFIIEILIIVGLVYFAWRFFRRKR